MRQGLALGGAGSLVAFTLLIAGLLFLRRIAARGSVLPKSLVRWLPDRLARTVDAFAVLFAEGILLPRQAWRRAMTVAASIAMKVMAALLPMLGAVLVEAFSFPVLFACSLIAALLQYLAAQWLGAI